MSDQELNVDNIKVREKMKIPELHVPSEDPSHMELEKCCGNCCWFYGEDTDGWGFCACQKNKDLDMMNCSDMCEDDYVSKNEMRHHMAVLLQYHRWLKDWLTVKRICPDKIELEDAAEFAYEYMKVFSEL